MLRLHARFDRWQLARVRRAYVSATRRSSGAEGFDGLVEEMQRGLAEATEAQRRQADERVLRTIFFGRPSVFLLRTFARASPRWGAWLMAAASPATLRWLVGDIGVPVSGMNRVPRCRFRAAGGAALCLQVCQQPTEAFCALEVVPVRLIPDAAGPGCTWVWGTPASDAPSEPATQHLDDALT